MNIPTRQIVALAGLPLILCCVKQDDYNVNREFFVGSWKSTTSLERIRFEDIAAHWCINYRAIPMTVDSTQIGPYKYDSYDSIYLIKDYKNWDLILEHSRIDFLDTFQTSAGQGNEKAIFYYSILDRNTILLGGIPDSVNPLFRRE